MDKPTILVVEDDPTLLDTLQYNLVRQQYQVCAATDGVSAIDIARKEKPDLIVLDLMLPGLDGLQVCRILRQEMTVPILMLTARDDEIDKIVGLEMGADDYMTKPFSMRELLARVKAQLRRLSFAQQETSDVESAPGSDRLVLGDLVIDAGRRDVTLKGTSLRLKPKEYDLLLFLTRNRNMALSRDLILERVWGWDYDGGTRTVDVHVRWLRSKIEEDPAKPTRIVTVRSVGYRFEA